MSVGILKIDGGECISDGKNIDINRVSRELSKFGYFVKLCICISDADTVSESFDYMHNFCDSILICGNTEVFYNALNDKYDFGRKPATFMIDETSCAVSENCDMQFVSERLIPMLNSKCKTFYATSVFHTIGKSEEQIKTALKDLIKNRNRISFKFESNPPECTVLVRYSNKTQKNTVYEMLSKVAEALKDCLYSFDEVPLAQKVAELLISENKTLGLAESFTGGNISASLVNFPGISQSFKEGIVCYSNEVKKSRLHVSGGVLNNHGAVSIETAYEMAANLLMDGKYDYVVATTGNAGPTAEKANEVGICYIAVGDKNNIDIYPYRFEGDRKAVIHSGTQTALYHLYKLLSANTANNNIEETVSND